jgi:hypothetical protein
MFLKKPKRLHQIAFRRRFLVNMGKQRNVIELLKVKGHDCNINDPPVKIRRVIRWAKRMFHDLKFTHVAPNVYLVDESEFEKVYKAHEQYRSTVSDQKAKAMVDLNDRIKKDKEQGLRDSKGRLVKTEGGAKPAAKRKGGRPPLPSARVEQKRRGRPTKAEKAEQAAAAQQQEAAAEAAALTKAAAAAAAAAAQQQEAAAAAAAAKAADTAGGDGQHPAGEASPPEAS